MSQNNMQKLGLKIAHQLQTRETQMASHVVSIDSVGNQRKTTLQNQHTFHKDGIAADYTSKQAVYDGIITEGDALWASKMNIINTVSDAGDAYKSLPELKTELDDMKAEVIAKAAAVQASVNQELQDEIDVWGSVEDMEAEFDGLDTDAPFSAA